MCRRCKIKEQSNFTFGADFHGCSIQNAKTPSSAIQFQQNTVMTSIGLEEYRPIPQSKKNRKENRKNQQNYQTATK